jgi:hypothetical protein
MIAPAAPTTADTAAVLVDLQSILDQEMTSASSGV